jgi:hypothetical protein
VDEVTKKFSLQYSPSSREHTNCYITTWRRRRRRRRRKRRNRNKKRIKRGRRRSRITVKMGSVIRSVQENVRKRGQG